MDGIDFSGLIPILSGIYGLLMAIGIVPMNPKDPEKMELWRRKFGGVMKILCPLIIGFGFLQLFRVLG
jgi:hypothetical protein